jgi:hypothetical protein
VVYAVAEEVLWRGVDLLARRTKIDFASSAGKAGPTAAEGAAVGTLRAGTVAATVVREVEVTGRLLSIDAIQASCLVSTTFVHDDN